jgi:hypothetical protein
MGLALGLGIALHEVSNAPDSKKSQVAVRETGGIVTGAMGSTAGTAAGTGAAYVIAFLFGLAFPPADLVLALGIGGGVAGGTIASEAGRANVDAAYQAAGEIKKDLEKGIDWSGFAPRFDPFRWQFP